MRNYLDALKKRVAPLENPYFQGLRDGTFRAEDFIETQIQFLFAVVYFSRPMMALAARLPHAEQRWVLFENVRDEHGAGDWEKSHEQTFLLFLKRLGVERSEIDRRALWPEVRAFNTSLTGLCAQDDVPTALAALGMIEELFASLSAEIGRCVVERGWLRAEELVHYPTHQELDLDHAQGFFRLCEPMARTDPRVAYQVEQGLELGAYIFLRMYEDLFRSRQRRMFREISGPHSSACG